MTPLFSLCHSTARLPDGWKAAYRVWTGFADHPETVEYILSIDAGREIEFTAPGNLKLTMNSRRRCAVDGWNAAGRAATGRILITVSDDWFPCPHWDTELLKVIGDPSKPAVVDVNCGGASVPGFLYFNIETRAYYEKYGYFFYPEYFGMCADDEFTILAKRDGVIRNARHLLFEHKHPEYGTASNDPTYEHQHRPIAWSVGRALFDYRMAHEFPPYQPKRDPRMNEAPEIILFCPVRERPDILEAALASHVELQGIKERWYFDDNDDPGSSALLRQHCCVTIPGLPPKIGYQGHGWKAESMKRMGKIRQYALDRWNREFSVFMVDADLLLHPMTAVRLQECIREASELHYVASEVFWSQWPASPNSPMFDLWLPNVWDADNYGYHSPDSILKLQFPGTYGTGGLGACTLIDAGAIEAGASYESIPNLLCWPGEDRHFCIRNGALGLGMLGKYGLSAVSCVPARNAGRRNRLVAGRMRSCLVPGEVAH